MRVTLPNGTNVLDVRDAISAIDALGCSSDDLFGLMLNSPSVAGRYRDLESRVEGCLGNITAIKTNKQMFLDLVDELVPIIDRMRSRWSGDKMLGYADQISATIRHELIGSGLYEQGADEDLLHESDFPCGENANVYLNDGTLITATDVDEWLESLGFDAYDRSELLDGLLEDAGLGTMSELYAKWSEEYARLELLSDAYYQKLRVLGNVTIDCGEDILRSFSGRDAQDIGNQLIDAAEHYF